MLLAYRITVVEFKLTMFSSELLYCWLSNRKGARPVNKKAVLSQRFPCDVPYLYNNKIPKVIWEEPRRRPSRW